MSEKPLPNYARALKAALAWRGWTIETLAQEMATRAQESPRLPALSASTLYSVQQGRRELRGWEIEAISDLLEVPDWFLRDGLAEGRGLSQPPAIDPRLVQAAEQIADVAQMLDALVSEQVQPRDAPPGLPAAS